MLSMYESFRDGLYRFALDEQMRISRNSESDEALSDLLMRPSIGDSIVFAFMTYVHRVLKHPGFKKYLAKLGCKCISHTRPCSQTERKAKSMRQHLDGLWTPRVPEPSNMLV